MDKPPLTGKRVRALGEVDAMPPALRACVHEFGLPIVQGFVDSGVSEPQRIRHLVLLCWTAAGAEGRGNGGGGFAPHIDALLVRNGGVTSADQLAALLRGMGAAMLPLGPSTVMVQASMAEVSKHGLLSKERKHELRLRAAMKAAARWHWPRVWRDE